MNNVDHIIKYLSGEMKQDDARSFEQELASNPVLKEEYEDVSAAFQLIREQLQKRDRDAFRANLLEVMEKSAPKFQGKSFGHRTRWYFLLPLAGSLAILLAIFFMNRGSDRILTRFFDPDNDPVVLAFNQGTRGETESGIVLYLGGHYLKSREKMSDLMNRDPDNQLALLYYLLASMEVELQEEALEKVLVKPINTDHQLGQSIVWYTTLALVKSGHMEEAALQLRPLSEQPGPYQTDAVRLQKMLLK